MNLIEAVLQEHFDDLGLAELGLSRTMGTALVTPRFVTSRHVVGIVFSANRSTPCVVAKVPRRPGDNAGVLHEARMLRALAEATAEVPLGVPRVLGTVDVGSHTVLVETAVPGTPLNPKAVCTDTDRAVRAGSQFIAALPVTRAAGGNPDFYEDAIAAPLRALALHAPLAGETAELVERTHIALQPLRRAALPAVFEHADLSHPNLFLAASDVLQVVDWERATLDGLPGQDLVYYLQYIGECARSAYTRPAQLRAFDDAFLAEGGWARLALQAHLASRGVTQDLLPALILAAWARSAATLVTRLLPEGAAGAVSPDAPSGDQLDAAVAQDRDFWLWRHALDRTAALQ